MSWQILIWNIFIWTLTSVIVYVTDSSLWWLLLPLSVTMFGRTSELTNESKPEELDEETRRKIDRFMENERVKARRRNQ